MSKKCMVAALAAAGLAVGLAAPAAAHVTAQPEEAEHGGYTAFAFRVPNERPEAGTVQLEVSLPADHPIGSVRTKPIPGWAAELTREGDRVSTITWTAEEGVRINPGEYQEFEISAGPLPTDTDLLVLPARQTYDSGEVVTWDAPPAADGAPEPEYPAPVLRLVPGGGSGHQHGAHSAVDDSTTPVMTDTGNPHDADTDMAIADSSARLLGGAGLTLGALGLGLAVGALLRIRQRGST